MGQQKHSLVEEIAQQVGHSVVSLLYHPFLPHRFGFGVSQAGVCQPLMVTTPSLVIITNMLGFTTLETPVQ